MRRITRFADDALWCGGERMREIGCELGVGADCRARVPRPAGRAGHVCSNKNYRCPTNLVGFGLANAELSERADNS